MAWFRRIRLYLVRKLAWLLIEAIVLLNRVSVTGQDGLQKLKEDNVPLIYIFWHRHILVVIQRFKNRGARPLISHSSDGDLVAAVAEEFAMRPVRGSSSKGGARAFLELARAVQEEKAEVLITADGPKGPARRVKEGAALLAAKTGAWVVPISWSATRRMVLEKSWDRFMVPLPFGCIRFAYGEPMRIAPAIPAEEMERVLDDLAARLNALEKQAGGEA